MKDDERADEAAGQLASVYYGLDELCVVVRTKGDDVRVIAPDYNKPYLAKMLRIAASMLDDRTQERLH